MRRSAIGRPLFLMVMFLVSVGMLGVSSALAGVPTGEFAVFSDCPLSNTALSGCISAKTESGKFIVGKETVPIEKAITLQGGFIENETTGALTFVAAADGNTLSKTPQKVPGGLL